MTATDSSQAVYSLLEEITLRPRTDLRDGVRLGRDLQVAGENYTLRLIPELERRLRIHPSEAEWSLVITVQDLLTLAQAHVNRQTLAIDPPWPVV